MQDVLINNIFNWATLIFFGGFGYIFKRIIDRIEKLETRPICRFAEHTERIDKLEEKIGIQDKKIEKIDTHYTDIKVRLAKIDTNLEYLKKNK